MIKIIAAQVHICVGTNIEIMGICQHPINLVHSRKTDNNRPTQCRYPKSLSDSSLANGAQQNN